MQHLDDELRSARVRDVEISDDTLTVHLKDGRSISCLLLWYPTLAEASVEERQNYRLIGDGTGIHWPDLDEDISVRGMLLGRSSPTVDQQARTDDPETVSP
jgi:hypothetical protein